MVYGPAPDITADSAIGHLGSVDLMVAMLFA